MRLGGRHCLTGFAQWTTADRSQTQAVYQVVRQTSLAGIDLLRRHCQAEVWCWEKFCKVHENRKARCTGTAWDKRTIIGVVADLPGAVEYLPRPGLDRSAAGSLAGGGSL